MNYLLDTNAVSEWFKPQPDSGLMRWTHTVDEDRTYLSVITIGELVKGAEKMPAGRRRERLKGWLTDELKLRFDRRILPVDSTTGEAWGRVMARTEMAGRCVGPAEGLIAATAEVHGLQVITRNIKHFEPTGVPVHSPWVH